MGNDWYFVVVIAFLLYAGLVACWYAFLGPLPEDLLRESSIEPCPHPMDGCADGLRWAICFVAVCLAIAASRYWWEVRLPLRPLDYYEVWAKESYHP